LVSVGLSIPAALVWYESLFLVAGAFLSQSDGMTEPRGRLMIRQRQYSTPAQKRFWDKANEELAAFERQENDLKARERRERAEQLGRLLKRPMADQDDVLN